MKSPVRTHLSGVARAEHLDGAGVRGGVADVVDDVELEEVIARDAAAGRGEVVERVRLHCVGAYISGCPTPLKGLHCQVSNLVNSDTCPRPTARLQRVARHVRDAVVADNVAGGRAHGDLGFGRIVASEIEAPNIC